MSQSFKGFPVQTKQELCPELLLSHLLEVLYRKDIINYATYVKSQKEVEKYAE